MKYKNLSLKITFAALAFVVSVAFAASSFAQDAAPIDKSKIPATGDKAASFVPAGWKIEEQIKGDVNADTKPDIVLKLVEDKPSTTKDDIKVDRSRALVVLLALDDGKLKNAAVADKLLQCTGCGGAFYGFVDAPANVKIEKGVIVVDQDHGSRDVSEMTFRFRYEASTEKFLLIGFDYSNDDRATGDSASESTNYVTGVRITKSGKGKGKSSKVSKTRIYIDDADYQTLEEKASARLYS